MEQEILTVSVSEVNHYIRRVLDHNGYLKDICIKGEISNCKRHPSGHIYLTLKDEASVLRAVMFRSAATSLRFVPEDGMKIIARGRISVYEPGGSYQLYINSMEPDGEGALYLAYEKLKKRLAEEGLFDPALKKPLPLYPQTVCVITASSGAAVRDILHILGRRYPAAAVKLVPVAVQGQEAAPQIVAAISLLNRHRVGDVIILGRGGGSIEDLWAFNEESVARAIFNSDIPIISAVGHETDFTIADFVSDLRAPTPSAAAELAVPSAAELQERLFALRTSLTSNIRYALQLRKNALNALQSHHTLTDFEGRLADLRMMVDLLQKDNQRAFTALYETACNRLAMQAGKLNALSPLSALSRGYSYAATQEGAPISSVNALQPGTFFTLRLQDGTATCISEKINKF